MLHFLSLSNSRASPALAELRAKMEAAARMKSNTEGEASTEARPSPASGGGAPERIMFLADRWLAARAKSGAGDTGPMRRPPRGNKELATRPRLCSDDKLPGPTSVSAGSRSPGYARPLETSGLPRLAGPDTDVAKPVFPSPHETSGAAGCVEVCAGGGGPELAKSRAGSRKPTCTLERAGKVELR